MASVVANLLSNLKHGKSKVFENEVTNSEMLAAGCAVGVACTFSAPVGGIPLLFLYSISSRSTVFHRGHGCLLRRSELLARFLRGHRQCQSLPNLQTFPQNGGWPRSVISVETDKSHLAVSVQAHFQTRFPITDAFLPTELPFFFFLG